MYGLSNALSVLGGLGTAKVATAVVAVTAAVTFAAGPGGLLPPTAGTGPTNPTAIAAKGDHPSPAAPTPGQPTAGADAAHTAVIATLQANETRLLTTLNGVISRLQANGNANDHAITALTNLVNKIDTQSMGLDKAQSAIDAAGSNAPGSPAAPSMPTLPPQASGHPSPPSHP